MDNKSGYDFFNVTASNCAVWDAALFANKILKVLLPPPLLGTKNLQGFGIPLFVFSPIILYVLRLPVFSSGVHVISGVAKSSSSVVSTTE